MFLYDVYFCEKSITKTQSPTMDFVFLFDDLKCEKSSANRGRKNLGWEKNLIYQDLRPFYEKISIMLTKSTKEIKRTVHLKYRG